MSQTGAAARLDLCQLTEYVKDLGEPAYRARQLNDWLKKGYGFEEMRNLPWAL